MKMFRTSELSPRTPTKKHLQTPPGWRMKAFNDSFPNTVREMASSFSVTEKLTAPTSGHDEHSQTGILTWGLQPRSRLPGSWPVAVGVCSPLQWRNRPRFPRGSRTPGCGEDGHRVHRFSKNTKLIRPNHQFAK